MLLFSRQRIDRASDRHADHVNRFAKRVEFDSVADTVVRSNRDLYQTRFADGGNDALDFDWPILLFIP